MSSGLLKALKVGSRKARRISLVLTLLLTVALLTSLPAKADYYPLTPPYPGKYESGTRSWFMRGGSAWGYADLGGTFNIGADLMAALPASTLYAYAGFYKDVNIPSDAIRLEVRATVYFASSVLRLPDGSYQLLPGEYYLTFYELAKSPNDWGGLWFKVDIDRIPPEEKGQGYYDTILYAEGWQGSYFEKLGGPYTYSVSINNPPKGWHRIYYGLVVGAHTENLFYGSVMIKARDGIPVFTKVEITIVRPTQITVSVSPNPTTPSAPVTISGQLTTLNGQGLAGQTVYLGYYGSPYTPIGTVTTKQYGYYDQNWNAPSKAGTYTVEARFYGTRDLLGSTATTTLTVNQPQNFIVSVSPSSATCKPGEAVTTTVYVYGMPTWPYTVYLYPYSGNPSPSSVSPSSGVPDFSAKWTITAPSTLGDYVYTIIAGSGASNVKTAKFYLNVQQPPSYDFSLSVSPSYVETEPGKSISATVSVSPSPQYPYLVNLYPQRGSTNPNAGYPPFTSTWSLTAEQSPGTYTYTITAVGGDGKSKTATLTVVVKQPQNYDFSMAVSPSSVEVEAGKTATVTVYVVPNPQYPYAVSLSPQVGSVSPNSGTPYFTAAWSIPAPSSQGTYIYRVTGYGADGKVRYAEVMVNVKSPPTEYYQGYVTIVNHYYAVDDVRADARFTSPIDWPLDSSSSNTKTMRKGDKDAWSAPNKLAFGDFFTMDVYVKLREYTTTTTQTVSKYYYNGRWNDSPPQNGVFKGYMEYSRQDVYYTTSVSLSGSLSSDCFWTIDQGDPFNKAKYTNGGSFSMSKSGLSGSDWVYVGSTDIFRAKSPKDAGLGEGQSKDAGITLTVSWNDGRGSSTTSKTVSVRLTWIMPEVRQVWSSPSSCAIRVYGKWADDNTPVKGRPYLYYSLDLENRRVYLKTGIDSNGLAYAESDPVDPQALRPTGYAVDKAFTIPVTPAVDDFGLMKSSVEYRELALSVYERSNTGFRLKVYEFHEPYGPVATARVTLFVKDLDSGQVREYAKGVDSQGYVSFTRGELSLPSKYEVWALAWGTENVNALYARSPFGDILLERVPVAP